MKKLLLFTLVLSMSLVVSYGQISLRHKFYVGGSTHLGFADNTYEYYKDGTLDESTKTTTSKFNFSPKAGFFLTNGLVIGLNLDLNVTKYDSENDDNTYTETTLLGGPFIRYYITKYKFRPVVGVAPLLGGMYWKDSEDNLFGVKPELGFAILMNEYAMFEFMLSYKYTNTLIGEDQIDNNVNKGPALDIGFAFTF